MELWRVVELLLGRRLLLLVRLLAVVPAAHHGLWAMLEPVVLAVLVLLLLLLLLLLHQVRSYHGRRLGVCRGRGSHRRGQPLLLLQVLPGLLQLLLVDAVLLHHLLEVGQLLGLAAAQGADLGRQLALLGVDVLQLGGVEARRERQAVLAEGCCGRAGPCRRRRPAAGRGSRSWRTGPTRDGPILSRRRKVQF